MTLNVLFVDDEASMCEVFADVFASEDIAVTTFTAPEKALAWAKTNNPDLIFLDYVLPGTNGDEIARQIENKVPIYLVTGMPNLKTKFPFVRVFGKPFKESEIRDVMLNHRESRKS